MTARDERALANIMARNRPQDWNPGFPEDNLWENIYSDLVRYLDSDNYRFDEQKFYDACHAKEFV